MKEREVAVSRELSLINRRTFISASVAFAVVGSIPFLANKEHPFYFDSRADNLTQKLLLALRDRQSAVQVGKVILSEQDSILESSDLSVSIMHNLGLSEDSLNSIPKADLIERLNKRTVVDFDNGAVFNTSGWILGQTEAQLCALAAKTRSAQLRFPKLFNGENNNV